MTNLNATLANIRDSRRRHGYSYTEAGERMSQAILDHVLSLSGPSKHNDALLKYEDHSLKDRHRKFVYRERSDLQKFAASVRLFEITMNVHAARVRNGVFAVTRLVHRIQKTDFELKA